MTTTSANRIRSTAGRSEQGIRRDRAVPALSAQVSVVRMNWNAVGTEHFGCPGNLSDPRAWSTPAGVPLGPPCNGSGTVQDYEMLVMPSYVEAYAGTTGTIGSGRPQLYVRNDLTFNTPLMNRYSGYFDNGTLSWFHTSSEVEPRNPSVAARYLVFRDWCKTGRTTCYAEPWADAWGGHGGSTDSHWCTPPAWMWWRVLSDLSNGVSRIALYGDNLEVAAFGTHNGLEVGDEFKGQFAAAVRLATRYAAYVASPSTAPGAFVAMRRSILPLAGYNERVQDYGLLADLTNRSREGVPGLDARNNGTDVPVVQNRTLPGMRSIGPGVSRFGAWARNVVPGGVPIEVSLDAGFVERLGGGGSTTPKAAPPGLVNDSEPESPVLCVTAMW